MTADGQVFLLQTGFWDGNAVHDGLVVNHHGRWRCHRHSTIRNLHRMLASTNADCAENACFKAGKEFGEREGQWVVVERSPHGLKSAGASFGANLARRLEESLKFTRCKGDKDVWMRKATKISDGSVHWECVCAYVDDILAISERPEEIMKVLASSVCKLKGVPGNPDDAAKLQHSALHSASHVNFQLNFCHVPFRPTR